MFSLGVRLLFKAALNGARTVLKLNSNNFHIILLQMILPYIHTIYIFSEENKALITANFIVTPNMKGYFYFDLTASDG